MSFKGPNSPNGLRRSSGLKKLVTSENGINNKIAYRYSFRVTQIQSDKCYKYM
ncbi:hypothetical protein HanPSC8_Chr11g0489291 [Helianthus annuus]|nr:hypothetical protein HanPSC8_Chr11g0489291 [Helianthus annuus]